MDLKVVTKEKEVELTLEELGLEVNSSDTVIIAAVQRHLDQNLDGYMVSRQDGKVLVSPAPVFG